MNATLTRDAGSYCFGAFQQNQQELARLEQQARATLELEHRLWERVGIQPGMRVLDLGCGPGVISCELADHVAPGEVVGVDLSDALLEAANQRRAQRDTANVDFQSASVYELPESLGQFDFVYARVLFQHLEHPERALQSIRRVLKPGGTLCIIDVDDRWLVFRPREAEFQELTRLAGEGQGHRGGNRYIGRELSSLLRQATFENVATHIESFTTEDVGVQAFLDITTGFKLEQIDPALRSPMRDTLAAIYDAVNDPLAWGAVGIFYATGQAPKRPGV